jgi:opacity protein-like surface antigen
MPMRELLMLYTVLLSLTIILTLLGGRPYAQAPPSGNEPAPAPAAAGPLETLPTAQERILAPVPQQFNWLGREAPSNSLLESLLSLQGPYRLRVSASLTEEVSDNFDHRPGDHRIGARTGVILGTVYRLDEGQDFISLANTVRAFYEVPTDRSQIGFANLVLNAGYQLLPLSFGLTESFVRDDGTAQDATSSLLRTQQRFIRNTVSPQVRYDITSRTAATLAYTNTLVIDEDSNQGNAISHAVTSGLQYQFSRNLTGSANYTFTTSDGSGASGRQFHRLQTNLGYSFDPTTSGILSAFGTHVDADTTPGQISRSYGASIGVRRVLFSTVSLFGSVGPTVFKRQGESERVRLNWNLRLDGPIPLFTTRSLTLSLTTNQEVQDTTGEVNDVGVVLRQLVAARLSYTPSAFFTALLLVEYTRNELLESGTTVGAVQGRTDNFWSTGLTASYALTNVLSLTGTYRYQRRTSTLPNNDFAENRVTIAVTGTFPVF